MLAGADSVHFQFTEETPQLVNRGGDKTYTLKLRQADSEAEALFYHAQVPLSANAMHTIRPAWDDLNRGTVEVEVDNNSDGTVDEVMMLDHIPLATPTESNVHITGVGCFTPSLPQSLFQIDNASFRIAEASASSPCSVRYAGARSRCAR